MRRFLLIIFLFITIQAYGQFVSSWYNIENGLPQNSVKDIVKDKYGFIWFSTENGLVKYDGLAFTTYNQLAIKNLHFGDFYGSITNDSIIIDNNFGEDKVLITKREIRKIQKKKLQKVENVIFLEENKGRMLKNTIGSAYYPRIHFFIKTDDGEYTFKKNEIVYTENNVPKQKISIPFSNSSLYNVFLSNEVLYITDPAKRYTHRIYRGELATSKKETLFNDPATKIFWQQLNNQTFIINNDHIYIVENNRNEPHLKFLVTYKDFKNYIFNSIFYDSKFNRLYLGSRTKGLNIIQLTQFFTAQRRIPFTEDVGHASLPFTKNTIIDPSGYEYNKFGIVKYHRFGINDIYFMLYDHSGNIILKRENFLMRRYKSFQYAKKDSVLFSGAIGLFKSNGLFAVSLTNDLIDSNLYIFKDDRFRKADQLFKFKGVINTFLKYNEELLIGCNNGLYSVSPKNTISLLAGEISVKSIIQTQDKEIWIATNKDGLFWFKDRKLFKIPLDKNGYLDTAHYILEDSSGYYWISSNNGLFKVSKKQLLLSIKAKAPVFYYRFTKSDGLLTNEFNGSTVPNAYSLGNGEFVFPSMDGFVFFDPKSVLAYYPDKEKIFIERARVYNTRIINFKDHLVLENDYNSADVFIDIPYYSDSYNLRIEAKIEGEDEKWEQIKIDSERKYTIRSLSPGEYTLKFRILISPDGTFEYKTVSFKIKPLFYQTNAFKIILIILLVSIIIYIIQRRTKFLREKNMALRDKVYHISKELKETSHNLKAVKVDMQKESEYQKKLVEAISHDIVTPVRYIAMLSHQLNKEKNTDLRKEYFDTIYESSEQLYSFTLQLKEYTDLYGTDKIYQEESYAVHDILIEKKSLFNEIAKSKKITIDVDGNNGTYSYINKNIIACIIHNVLDNAVKYTDTGKIHLATDNMDDQSVIIICDTGNGMSAEQITYYNELYHLSNEDNRMQFKNYGLGLHMVIHLIKKINAEIEFNKNLPKGTIIKIILKK